MAKGKAKIEVDLSAEAKQRIKVLRKSLQVMMDEVDSTHKQAETNSTELEGVTMDLDDTNTSLGWLHSDVKDLFNAVDDLTDRLQALEDGV